MATMSAALLLALGTCGTKSVPNFAAWKVNDIGYQLEPLPFAISASYARGDDVYLCSDQGELYRASDQNFAQTLALVSRPLTAWARLLFVSSAGDIFISANHQPTYRSTDGGLHWDQSLDVPVWRMDEDDQGNLYAGNYTKDPQHVATLYKSTDRGATWAVSFQDKNNHHIHTVRWHAPARRLYIAWGDSGSRGEAYSDDRGATWNTIASGAWEGHTDVCFTDRYIIWCSDDQSGRVFRTTSPTGPMETLMGGTQFVWFGVAAGKTVFVGTMSSQRDGGDRAALLVSNDQGTTWQKLLETVPSVSPYSCGFIAESRNLSTGGWLYFSLSEQHVLTSYRVRLAAP
jgi:photosystem II stability/assembly factor-like uncharacterized protein